MNKRNPKIIPRLMAIALSVIMVMSVVPVSAAAGTGDLKSCTIDDKQSNELVKAEASVIAEEDTNGTARVLIPDKAVTDAITKAQADAKTQGKTAEDIFVELNVLVPQEATSLTITLTQSSLNSLVSAGVSSLKITGSLVTVTFDKNAITEIRRKSSGDSKITIASDTRLSVSAKAMIGTRPVYSITVGYGKDKTVTSFGRGTVAVSIPYILGKNEAEGGLYAAQLDARGKAVRIASSAYDANSRSVIFTAGNSAVYGVGYTAPKAKYTDISSHWGKDSIDYVVGRGLLSGTSKTAFAPDKALTREMLVMALGKLAGVDTKRYTTNSFKDVKTDSAYRPYIEWAYKKGIMRGTGSGNFAPGKAITREKTAVVLTNYARAIGYTLPVIRNAVTFGDADRIGGTCKTAVKAMQQAGIMMSSADNAFNPKVNITRAEVSAVLHRYIKLTIDPATAQGWAKNDAGQQLYYKDGKALNGWAEISDKWYYFYTDGTLARNTTIGGYLVDEHGVRKEEPKTGGSAGGNSEPLSQKELDVTDKDESVEVFGASEVGFTNLNPEDNGEEPVPQAVMTNYLLYGYNVLKYGYINEKYIDTKYAVFDVAKLKEGDGGNYKTTSTTSTEIKYLYSKSASSLYEDFDITSSAKYKGVFFSGSVKGEYGLSTAISEDKVLIKHIQAHTTGEQAYTVDVDTLQGMVSGSFSNAVVKYASGSAITNPNYNPDFILEHYGTHAITQYYTGGRSELNFVFTNQTQEREETIKASVEAAYRGFSGKASASDKQKSRLVLENSSTSFSSVGGKNISGTTAESIASKFDEWVNSIKEYPVLCGIANFDQSLVPIWELVDDAKISENLRTAFNTAAAKSETDLSMLSGVPLYITDIFVSSTAKSEDALQQIPDGYTKVLLNPGTSSKDVLEANKGAGGNYIYIAYKLSTDKSRAITDIQVVSGDSASVTGDSEYTKIPVDLNEKAGGKYIYLCYKRITDDEKKSENIANTVCLKEIRGIYADSYSIPDGWKWAYKSGSVDLNGGCKKSGAQFIRLLVRKDI